MMSSNLRIEGCGLVNVTFVGQFCMYVIKYT
jgi:hypothetical protein